MGKTRTKPRMFTIDFKGIDQENSVELWSALRRLTRDADLLGALQAQLRRETRALQARAGEGQPRDRAQPAPTEIAKLRADVRSLADDVDQLRREVVSLRAGLR